jgi:hypothetical protein
VGSRSPDGWDQIPYPAAWWLGTSHPGVLVSIPKREEPGKTGAPCVKVPGSSRVPAPPCSARCRHHPLLWVPVFDGCHEQKGPWRRHTCRGTHAHCRVSVFAAGPPTRRSQGMSLCFCVKTRTPNSHTSERKLLFEDSLVKGSLLVPVLPACGQSALAAWVAGAPGPGHSGPTSRPPSTSPTSTLTGTC